MKLGLAVLGLVSGACASSVREEVVPRTGIDECIERLAVVGDEYRPAGEGWELEPAAKALHEHLNAGGELDARQWKRALEVSRALRVRATWPAEVPFALSVDAPAWVAGGRVTATPLDARLRSARSPAHSWCGNCQEELRWKAHYQELGQLSAGRLALELEVEIEGTRGRFPGQPERLWRGTLPFELELVTDFDDALPGASDPQLDAAVRRRLDVLVLDERELRVSAGRAVPELAETALSLALELRNGSELVGAGTLAFPQDPDAPPRAWSLELPTPTPTGLTLRLRGIPDGTLRDWDARQYWNGELVLPVDELPRR